MKARLPHQKHPVRIFLLILLILFAVILLGILAFWYFNRGTGMETAATKIGEKINPFAPKKELSAEGDSPVVTEENTTGAPAEEQAPEISADQFQDLQKRVGEKGYVNKAYSYALVPPEGWYPDPGNSDINPFVYFTSYDPATVEGVDELPGAKVEIVVQQNSENKTLDEWVAEGHGYKKMLTSEKIKIGNYEAVKEEVNYDGPMASVEFIKGDSVYSFSISASDADYAKYKGEFEKMIASLIVL